MRRQRAPAAAGSLVAARARRPGGVLAALLLAAFGAAAQAACPAPTEKAAAQLRQEVQQLTEAQRWAEAVPKAQCLVEVAGVVFGAAHATTQTLRRDLAAVLRRAGEPARAAALEREIAAADEPELDAEVQATLTRLVVEGKSLHDRGDYQGAGQRCIAARRLIAERQVGEHLLVAIVLGECGRIFEAFGQHDMAEARYRESDAMARRVAGPRNGQSAVALNNLGNLYWKTRRYAEAATTLRQSLDLTAADDPEAAPTLTNLGLAEGALGRDEAARGHFLQAQALVLRHHGADHPTLVPVHDNLAALAWKSGRLGEAVGQQVQANRVAERNIAAVIGLGSERQKLDYMRTFTDQVDASVSLGLLLPRDQAAGTMALEAVLQRKGRVLSALAASLDRVRRRSSPADAELWAALVRNQQQRAQLDAGAAATAAADRERIEGLLARLAGADPAAADLARPVGVDGLRRALPAGSALLEFTVYRPRAPAGPGPFAAGAARYAAFLLRGRGELVWLDLGARQDIDRLVSDLRAGLANPRAVYTREIASELHRVLFGRLEAQLKGVDRLYLAPDGALNLVPMAVLVDAAGQTLLDRTTLSYLSSGRELLRPAGTPGARQASVVVANPAFGASAAGGPRCGPFDELPGTQAEADAIVPLLPGVQVLADTAATETAVKALRRPRVLHLATHGYFGPLAGCGTAAEAGSDKPAAGDALLRSGLLLAGANRLVSGRDDGILTAAEVSAMDLSGTELVVLSACDSGLGDVVAGEGVFGLRRAFELAGARRQVMSLWKVPDAQTARLMTLFYAALHDGQEPARALASAQKALRGDAAGVHAAPFYWAAFIVSGDARPFEP